MATFNGTPDRDILYGTDVADEIHGGPGNDDIFGLSGDDALHGDDGNDLLDGGSGDDALDGGIGDDIYVVDSLGDSVTDSAGIDEIRTTLSSYTLGLTMENLTGLSADGQSLFGNALANVITGGAGEDEIDGGGGNDTCIVGDGDKVRDSGGGTDLVISKAATQALGGGIENLTGWNYVNQTLIGNNLANVIRASESLNLNYVRKTLLGGGGNDTLWGGGGIDRLDGGAGADTMIGGAGDDTYVVDHAGDTVSEAGHYYRDDIDEVLTSVDFTLSDYVDNLTGTSDAGLVLSGNNWNNILRGGTGADTFQGGFGNDIYYVDANDLVIESTPDDPTPHEDGTRDEIRTSIQVYTLQQSVENLIALDHSGKVYTGNFKLNLIVTGAGDDIIDGGAHGDRMIGGAGNDIYYVDEKDDGTDGGTELDDDVDVVVELGGQGIDEIRTSFNFTLGDNVENLSARAGSGPLNLTGNSLNNVITGGAFDDALIGGRGDDRLVGGGGIDTAKYTTATRGVVVSLLLTEAQDTVGAGIDTLASIENLSGSIYSDILRGNDGNNKLSGGAGDDLLRGFGGNDQLLGGTGVDGVTYVGTDGRVVVDLARTDAQNTGGAGVDTLNGIEDVTGSSFADTLRGDARANRIVGGDGADRLEGRTGADNIIAGAGADLIFGGAQKDVLTGGTGGDRFYFDDGDSGATRQSADILTDFSRNGGDRISLRDIDANMATAADENFSFIGTGAFSGKAGELRYQEVQGAVFVEGDTNGDGNADFVLHIEDGQPLLATDFIL